MSYADPLDPRARAARRKHYDRNKQQYVDRATAARALGVAIIREAKDVPCMDCGLRYPYYVMDFDHRNPADKIAGVRALANYGEKKLRAEIAKCDVVCANCHRERTHGV